MQLALDRGNQCAHSEHHLPTTPVPPSCLGPESDAGLLAPITVNCLRPICTILAEKVPQRGRSQNLTFDPLDQNVVDHLVQRFHPLFWMVGTGVQDAYL